MRYLGIRVGVLLQDKGESGARRNRKSFLGKWKGVEVGDRWGAVIARQASSTHRNKLLQDAITTLNESQMGQYNRNL